MLNELATADPDPHTEDLAVLVKLHQVEIWRRLRALGCSPADADELTVEVFARAHARGLDSTPTGATYWT